MHIEGNVIHDAPIIIRAPARAWEGAELHTSYPPLRTLTQRVGTGTSYILYFDLDTARALRDFCELGFDRDWHADPAEKAGSRTMHHRLNFALNTHDRNAERA